MFCFGFLFVCFCFVWEVFFVCFFSVLNKAVKAFLLKNLRKEEKVVCSAREEDSLISECNTDQGKDQIIAFHRHHEEFYI